MTAANECGRAETPDYLAPEDEPEGPQPHVPGHC